MELKRLYCVQLAKFDVQCMFALKIHFWKEVFFVAMMKPDIIYYGENCICYVCPNCGYDTFSNTFDEHCDYCGQAFDWSEIKGNYEL